MRTRRSKDWVPPEVAALQFCEGILSIIGGRRWKKLTRPFETPVDYITLGIPDYPDVIKQPMDISTIAQKLGKKQYGSAFKFKSDFDLMFRNCFEFNDPESAVYQSGEQFQEEFEDLWTIKDDWMKRYGVPIERSPTPTPKISEGDGGPEIGGHSSAEAEDGGRAEFGHQDSSEVDDDSEDEVVVKKRRRLITKARLVEKQQAERITKKPRLDSTQDDKSNALKSLIEDIAEKEVDGIMDRVGSNKSTELEDDIGNFIRASMLNPSQSASTRETLSNKVKQSIGETIIKEVMDKIKGKTAEVLIETALEKCGSLHKKFTDDPESLIKQLQKAGEEPSG